jgi:hypothetical protein
MYVVKVKKYETGTPEEFLRWMLNLNIRRPSAFLSNFRSRKIHIDYE